MAAAFVIGVGICLMVSLRKRNSRPQGALTLSPEGARYTRGDEAHEVAWSDLVEVGLLNTSDGPRLEDQFWILIGASGGRCVVPASDALPLLKVVGKLPRFDHEAVIRSAGCTDDASFRCWTGAAGEAAILRDVLSASPGPDAR